MDIQQDMVGDVLVVAPKGRLDTETSGELELALHDAFEAGKYHFLVDMSQISYVSSAGLRVLLSLAKKVESGIGSLRVCSLNPTVKQVFDLSGFTSLFKISNHRADALKAMPQSQGAPRVPANPAGEPPTPRMSPSAEPARPRPAIEAAPAAPAPKPVAQQAAVSAAIPAEPSKPAASVAPATPSAPVPASRSAADLLGVGAKSPAAKPDAASLLGVSSAAPAAVSKPSTPAVDQATSLLMPSVSATEKRPAPPVSPPVSATAPPATPEKRPAPEPKAPAPVATPSAPPADPAGTTPSKPATPAKKGSWSKLFKE